MSQKWTLFLLFLLATASLPAQSIDQGIEGYVYRRMGNLMPLKGKTAGRGSPIITEIYFYEPTKLSQVQGQEGKFLKQVGSKLVKKVPTNKAGFYKACLPEGQYTVLVLYQTLYYVPYFSGQEYLSLVKVDKGKTTALDIIIEAAVSY